jgi:type II secretory pathway pseudopilin PulG
MEIRRWRADAGIAVGPILFIIAILGLLAAAIAAGSGSFTADVGTSRAKANAQALVEYANQLQFAVQFLFGRGCTDVELTFQETNANAPADHSCDVFHPDGAGMVDSSFANLTGAFDTSIAGNHSNWWGTYGHFSQNYTATITGLGSHATLIFQLFAVNLATCTEINRILQYNPSGNFAPPVKGWHISGGYFYGIYADNGPYNLGSEFNSVRQACVRDNIYANYVYIGVLLPRD